VIQFNVLQISKNNLEEQLTIVAKVFWPEDSAATNRVIPCSSKMGLSAAVLLHDTINGSRDGELPEYNKICDRNSIGYSVSIFRSFTA
jgi:hypothetical protein